MNAGIRLAVTLGLDAQATKQTFTLQFMSLCHVLNQSFFVYGCVWNKRLNLALDISLIRPVDSNFDPNLFCSSQGCFLKRSIVCLPSKAMAFSRRFFVAVHDLNRLK